MRQRKPEGDLENSQPSQGDNTRLGRLRTSSIHRDISDRALFKRILPTCGLHERMGGVLFDRDGDGELFGDSDVAKLRRSLRETNTAALVRRLKRLIDRSLCRLSRPGTFVSIVGQVRLRDYHVGL